ncbi:hypothetical protein [Hyalangium minutum]|uniref:Uncharacterized protein n=1 Tax=Hyalangium minutum TaxID=394096 RepID=A0A085WCC3_9BACT|nr:hypothetical protein [Hyalangium minutum]KFE65336.1 hypothetical protein DB31_1452 [Hyalangium minutum]
MYSGARTARLPIQGREPLRLVLLVGPALLALVLTTWGAGLSEPTPTRIAHGREPARCVKVTQGTLPGPGMLAQQPCMQPKAEAPQEWAALTSASPAVQLHAQLASSRGRARLLPDAQSLVRLIRQRQDAIILAWTHRMRDASEPGAASHTADRPQIVTRPLRGPPARG